MSRTKEQVSADEALTVAIEAMRAAYPSADDEPDYMMTDYIVVYAGLRFDDEGDTWTKVGILFRDSGIPAYRAVGLLRFAERKMGIFIAQDED